MDSTAMFDSPLILPTGTYWFEANIIGPLMNVWLTSLLDDPNVGSRCWTNFTDDLYGISAGLQPCHRTEKDLNFVLEGTVDYV